MNDQRFKRQMDFFGAEGQERLENSRVGVLGLGGLGSHVCQQLAYLGIRSFVLVDGDTVEETNLNRLIGAVQDDLGLHKTRVAERQVLAILPMAVIDSRTVELPDGEAWKALEKCDLLIGCFDNDYSRLLTTRFASQHRIPYFDAATEIRIDDGSLIYGGRVIVSGTSEGCIYCLGYLDQDEIRRFQESEREAEVEARIYGVSVASLKATGPSVVSLNGVVASLAVMEVMAFTTGLRKPVQLQTYQGSWGRVTRSIDQPKSCPFCEVWLS